MVRMTQIQESSCVIHFIRGRLDHLNFTFSRTEPSSQHPRPNKERRSEQLAEVHYQFAAVPYSLQLPEQLPKLLQTAVVDLPVGCSVRFRSTSRNPAVPLLAFARQMTQLACFPPHRISPRLLPCFPTVLRERQ